MLTRLVGFLAALLLTLAAAAADRAQRFDITPQALDAALFAFSRQSGLQVFYPSKLGTGLRSQGVQGEMSAAQALQQLLQGTGLTWRFSNGNTIVLYQGVTEQQAYGNQIRLREEVIVTGSHIPRGDQLRSPSPITTLERDALLDHGNIELPQLLSDLPFSSGAEVQVHNLDQPLTAGTGAINLRNLGLGATMVLLDGQRQTNTAVATTEGETFVDLNSLLPLVMIERIEILRDGASATYGSDAVAGVINIIPRRDYRGLTLQGRYQATGDNEQAEQRVSLLYGKGFAAANMNFTSALSYLERDRLATVARDFTAGSVISSFGQPGTYLGSDGFIRDPACGVSGGIAGSGEFCQFDASPYFDLVPEEKRLQWYNTLEADIGSASHLRATLAWNEADVWVTASPSFPFATALPQVPEHNPGNLTGEPLLFYGRVHGAEYGASRSLSEYEHSFAAVDLDSDYRDFTLGLKFSFSRNTVDYGRVDTVRDRLQAALDGRDGLYWNPLHGSDNDPALVAGLFSDWGMRGETELYTVDLLASTDWFQQGSWHYAFALGGHFRREELEHRFGAEYNAKQLLALGGGPDFSARRDISAAFGEIHLVPLESLEIQLAVRYENYDRELDSLSPKLALRWQLAPQAAVRASYSRAFRAPSLFQSGASQSTPQAVSDDLVPGTPFFTNVITMGGGDLDPEEADVFNLGGTLGERGQLQLDLDLWYYDYRDIILKEDPQGILQRAAGGDAQAQEKVTRDPVSGHLLQIDADFINAASLKTAGADVTLNYPFELWQGAATLGTSWTWTGRYDLQERPGSPEIDGVGSRNASTPAARTLPEWKGNAWFNWQRARHRAGLRLSYIDAYRDDANGDARVDSYTSLDMHYRVERVFGLPQLAVAGGLLNALDEEPPRLDTFLGYDAKAHDPRGRLWYLQVDYSL